MEGVLDDAGYILRYERGSFQSGYCILEQKRVAVVNKFLTTEGRINTLAELIPALNITYEVLTTDSQKMYDMVIGGQKNNAKQTSG